MSNTIASGMIKYMKSLTDIEFVEYYKKAKKAKMNTQRYEDALQLLLIECEKRKANKSKQGVGDGKRRI